jgi:hypothetical protein
LFMSMGWDYISDLWPQTGLLFISRTIYEYGQPWWNDIDRWKNEELREKPIPVPLRPPPSPHGLTWAWTQASAVKGQRVSAWAMARPVLDITLSHSVLLLETELFWQHFRRLDEYNSNYTKTYVHLQLIYICYGDVYIYDCDRFFLEFFGFPLLISFHHSSPHL